MTEALKTTSGGCFLSLQTRLEISYHSHIIVNALNAHSMLSRLQQITKKKVDRMKSNPAHCLLAIKWRGEFRHRIPDVSHKVD